VFEKENVGMRVSGFKPELLEQDEKELTLVKWSCEINPFTPELAGELHDKVKRTLYTASNVEVDSLISGVSFDLSIPPQSLVVRMAPDQKKASFRIDEAKISGIHAKRSKKSTAWTLGFTVTFMSPSEHFLAQAFESFTKTRYVIFADAEPNLFDTRGEEARKHRKANAEADADDEGNHAPPSEAGLPH
jgi:hypothetical protein